ncbi:MAG: hypothetical protein DMG14_18720 [Acidobacteria bacterium]|nr:MAG: hypothetical protein DMG14_18720 [Acidobacteriota bacterium]
MKKILGLTLGIMPALGGFVDLGQIVFTMQAGALFGYALLGILHIHEKAGMRIDPIQLRDRPRQCGWLIAVILCSEGMVRKNRLGANAAQ